LVFRYTVITGHVAVPKVGGTNIWIGISSRRFGVFDVP